MATAEISEKESGDDGRLHPWPLIYILEMDGEVWATVVEKVKGSRVVKKIHVDTIRKCRKVIANPGEILPAEVAALADHTLAELKRKYTLWDRVKKPFKL